jgi:hypothetical protein
VVPSPYIIGKNHHPQPAVSYFLKKDKIKIVMDEANDFLGRRTIYFPLMQKGE